MLLAVCVLLEFNSLKSADIIKHETRVKLNTYIIKEDGRIAMAQFANLPSRLFHILFGQPPGEEEKRKRKKKAQDRKQRI